MLTLAVWVACVFLESLVLFRSFRARIFSRYPFFCVYLACVIATELSSFAAYRMGPSIYLKWYWGTEFVCLIVGCGILLDILDQGLSAYAGAKRFAISAGYVAYAVILGYAIIQTLTKPVWSPMVATDHLERDLRVVQAAFLAGLMAVVYCYGIEFGRNLKGIILGYGLYIASAIAGLALGSYIGPSFTAVYSIVQSYSYLASLVIWTFALWAYHPNPEPDSSVQLEADYESFVLKTRHALGTMKSYLAKAARP